MKVSVAQTRPYKGDIQRNIEEHINLIEMAATYEAETIIFPELSITGYVPELSKELATTCDDERFDVFQKISDLNQMTIGIGMPIRNKTGITISTIIFQPNKFRQLYSKKFLHPSEEKLFISGNNTAGLIDDGSTIAFAICYELSVAEHSQNAYNSGAEIYVASVAKSAFGVEKARDILPEIARKYSMTVLMSNYVGNIAVIILREDPLSGIMRVN